MTDKMPDIDDLLNNSNADETVLQENKTNEKKKPVNLVNKPKEEKATERIAMYFTKSKLLKIDQLLELETGLKASDKGHKKARQTLIHNMIEKELRRNGILI